MKDQDTMESFDVRIEACEESLHACQECVGADLREGDPAMATCSLLNLDCADICAATINALARRSVHHGDFCALCAHLCRACAAECAKHEHEHCLRCKEACERCAQACDQHASHRHPM